MMEWCIDELRYRAAIYQKTGYVYVYNGDVVKSDTAVPEELKLELRQAVRPLEDVPEKDKDWHPGSDEKVLDLVHPSLFPLVYGKTRILEDSLTSLDDCVERCGEGKVIPIPSVEETQQEASAWSWQKKDPHVPFSRRFQWLPCDVEISKDGKGRIQSKITSYINNLHPAKFPKLYDVIEKIISCAIPLWNSTLTPLRYKPRDIPCPRIRYLEVEYDYGDDDDDDDDDEDGEDEDDDNDDGDGDDGGKTLIVPDPTPWRGTRPLPEEEIVDLVKEYGDRGLQVIVKLANIHLTPEKPEYEGGTWHVEGQLNEHICATALYYYDNENTATSHLAFRQQASPSTLTSVNYQQDEHDWLTELYGLESWSSSVQQVGSVETREGRLLTFPNILQHQVQPFKLADPTKPGHRKILALFLVDPNLRVISTAHVPCQRKDWWAEELRKSGIGPGMKGGAVKELPRELQDLVFEKVEEFPIGMEEAKELRLQLMEERRSFVLDHDKAFHSTEISLCEH
ncbi:hypothetical protein AX16_006975 [Volvariella volvacea WC 439]|nr:hypothetical protein AX16_006975 [Volvariella volvacea WC 439]